MILFKKKPHQFSSIINPSEKFDYLFAACLALAPLCFLSIRGWTNSFFILLIILSFYKIIQNYNIIFIVKKNSTAAWLIIALASSFISILLTQVLRNSLHINLMDGPLRPFLAIIIFIYLLTKNIDFVRTLEWSAPLSLIILGAFLFVHPYEFVNIPSERFGTTAVDPLTLGQYSTLLGFICLFTFNLYGNDKPTLQLLKLIGILVAVWISIGTASRSGWVAVPFLLLIWVVKVQRVRQPHQLILALAGLGALGVMVYGFMPVVHERISQAVTEYVAYFHGGAHDTAAGIRLSMLRAAGTLFWSQPWTGYGDAHYPAFSSIPAIAPFNTPVLEFTMVNSGVHNEIMQSALRSGIFGLVSSILMFVVPAVVFYRGCDSTIPSVRAAGLVGLCYIVAVFCFGLSTETFNLKYTVSFYALMVSVLAAQVLRPQPV